MRDFQQKKYPSQQGGRKGQGVNRPSRKKRQLPWQGIKKALRYVAATLALAALCAGAVAGVSSAGAALSGVQLFPLGRIEVEGGRQVSQQEVRELAALRLGDSLYGYSLPDLAKKIGKNPWVKEVSVRRLLPDTLHIDLSERQAAGIVSLRYLYYVDRDGTVFKPLAQQDDWGLPIVTGVTEAEVAADPQEVAARLKKALELVQQLKKGRRIALEDFSEINMDRHNGYTLFTSRGGIPIALGLDDYDAKLDRLALVCASLKDDFSQVAYIDLHHADRVVVGYRTPQYQPPKPVAAVATPPAHH